MKSLNMDKVCEITRGMFSNIGLKIAYIYALLPIIIFLTGWCKWYIGLVGFAFLIYSYVKMCGNIPKTFTMKWTRENIEKAIFILGFVLFWVLLSGIGKYVYQNTDHYARNGIFETLVNIDWPVIKCYETENGMVYRGLVYYIGFWLPSAVIGKIFGIEAGYFSQYVWAVIGIIITYYLVCVVRGKFELWPFWILVFFSGVDLIGYYLRNGGFQDMSATTHLEWWTDYQFSSFTTQLFWVFNQALPAWIIFLLLYIQKNNKQIVLILSASMLVSTLPFAGMILYAVYFMIRNIKWEGKLKTWFIYLCKDTLTIENVLGGGMIAFICMTYLLGNTAVDAKSTLGAKAEFKSVVVISEYETVSSDNTIDVTYENQRKREDKGAKLLRHIISLLVEVAPYLILVYPFCKNISLFYLMCVMFLVCHSVTSGYSTDVCMRASIPSLLLLALFTMEALEKMWEQKRYIYFVVILVTLSIGAATPIHEMHRTIQETWRRLECGEQIAENTASEDYILQGANFSGPIDNNFFFYYIAK